MLAPVRPLFRSIASTVVPDAAQLSEQGWNEVERVVEAALARRPAPLRRQLALFLRAIEWLPLLRYGRRFTALDAARRARFLGGLQNAPLLLVRRGFWGLRTLVLMGYYGRGAARAEIGYRAHPRGWEARGR